MDTNTQYKSRIVGHEEVDPKTIILNPNNPRVHPDNQKAVMDNVLKRFGWINNVVVNTVTGHLVDGEMRVLEAIKNKESTVPVTLIELSEEEEQQLIAIFDPIGYMADESAEMFKKIFNNVDMSDESISDVVNSIIKRNRISFAGDTDDEEDDNEHEDGNTSKDDNTVEKRLQQLLDKWEIETGQIWKIGDHQLMCGDAHDPEDVGALMDGKKASCGFFDPPYGVEYRSNKRKSKFDVLEGDDVIEAGFIPATIPHMKNDYAFYVCTKWNVYPEWYSLIVEHIPVKNVIIWHKPGGGIGDLKGNYIFSHEFVLFCAPDEHKLRGTREGNVWNFGGRNLAGHIHPTQKPVELPAKCFEHSSNIGDIVLDFFIGSGTSIISANNVQRVCYAMDKDAKWVAASLERLSELGFTPERIV